MTLRNQNSIDEFKNTINDITIIYEDDDVLVINKPKNILIHPTSFNEQDTVVQIFAHKIKKNEFVDQTRPGVVSRIDRNTTGLCILAKNKYMYDSLIEQTSKNQIIKQYLAIVHNCFKDKQLTIKLPLKRSKQQKLKMVVSNDQTAKMACTEVTVLENFKNTSLISCRLLTGRTHQIRCHLAYIHHPIFNDPLYGKYDGIKNYDQFLHSSYLKFYHPRLKKYIELELQPDTIFINILEKMRKENC